MVDVILVLTKKGSGDEQCSDVHNNIKVESAEIDSIPATGGVFYVLEDVKSHKKCTLLRIYSKMDRVDHYDHVIFAEVSEVCDFSGYSGGIMAFSGTYPESVKKDNNKKLCEYFKKDENIKKFIEYENPKTLDDVSDSDEYSYMIIKVPVEGGNDYCHILHVLNVKYGKDGKIIRLKTIAFIVISNDGCMFKPVDGIEEANKVAKEFSENQVLPPHSPGP